MVQTSLAPERSADALPPYRCEVWDRIGTEWDAMVATFADACLEQMAAYLVPRWGSSHLTGILLREAATSEPLALAAAVIATIPIVKLGLAYIKFGPLWRRRGRPANPRVLAAALDGVKRALAVDRGLVVRVLPPPDPDYEREWRDGLPAADFKLHAPLPDAERYLVDLTLSEEAQLSSLGANWRANLKKALAQPLEIRELPLQHALPEFLALYNGMVARKQFVDRHGIHVLPDFAAAAQPALGARMFVAYHEGRAVAATLIVGGGERVSVPFSAADEAARALRASYALRWHVIRCLRGSHARWLDLGGAESDPGLRSFKRGNVGRRGQVVTLAGEFDYAATPFGSTVSAIVTLARKLVEAMPGQPLPHWL
jgi:hypothetical protein